MLVGTHIFGMEVRRRHLIGVLAGFVAVGLVLAWTLLPSAGLRWGLVKTLHGLGMVEVSVSDADLSLFGGNLVVRKMVARAPAGTTLGVKDFALRFRWTPLLNKRVVLDRVTLEGVEIDIHRENDGSFVINGLPLAVAAAPPGQPEGAATEWGIDVATLELNDSRLVLSDDDARAEIAVQRLVVENLHSRNPDSAPSFTLQGYIEWCLGGGPGQHFPLCDPAGFQHYRSAARPRPRPNPALGRQGWSWRPRRPRRSDSGRQRHCAQIRPCVARRWQAGGQRPDPRGQYQHFSGPSGPRPAPRHLDRQAPGPRSHTRHHSVTGQNH